MMPNWIQLTTTLSSAPWSNLMTDLTPNDLSQLSDDEFNALCPQGHHAPGLAQPLSPAAQAVKDAVLALYSDQPQIRDWGWQLDAPTVTAALRAAANDWRVDTEFIGGVEYIRTSTLDTIAAELEALPND
jgi:hypothetical protein